MEIQTGREIKLDPFVNFSEDVTYNVAEQVGELFFCNFVISPYPPF